MILTGRGAAVLLDLDGVLTDPRQGMVSCLQRALHKICADVPSIDVLVSHIGPPHHEILVRLLGVTHRRHLDNAVGF